MIKPRWTIKEQVGKGVKMPLRELLQRKWLLPRRLVHFLRIRHQVLVNGEYLPVNTKVDSGDVVQLNFTGDEFRTSESNYIPEQDPQVDVLWENRDLLVVNKPAGQKTHPNQPLETGTLMNHVAGFLRGTGNAAYMVHRIDQETSGALIVAKNPVVVPILDRYISLGEIHRQYLAVVNGKFTHPQGVFTWPIGRNPTDKRKRMVNGANSQPAVTEYEVIGEDSNLSLVKLKLHTGRTHQIRVHLAHSGHPIVGDPLYNNDGQERMLLHGVFQKIVVPFKLNIIQIFAPVPDYFPRSLVIYWKNNK